VEKDAIPSVPTQQTDASPKSVAKVLFMIMPTKITKQVYQVALWGVSIKEGSPQDRNATNEPQSLNELTYGQSHGR
jgi:hypothetical protein